jgi:hypothetical protein
MNRYIEAVPEAIEWNIDIFHTKCADSRRLVGENDLT